MSSAKLGLVVLAGVLVSGAIVATVLLIHRANANKIDTVALNKIIDAVTDPKIRDLIKSRYLHPGAEPQPAQWVPSSQAAPTNLRTAIAANDRPAMIKAAAEVLNMQTPQTHAPVFFYTADLLCQLGHADAICACFKDRGERMIPDYLQAIDPIVFSMRISGDDAHAREFLAILAEHAPQKPDASIPLFPVQISLAIARAQNDLHDNPATALAKARDCLDAIHPAPAAAFDTFLARADLTREMARAASPDTAAALRTLLTQAGALASPADQFAALAIAADIQAASDPAAAQLTIAKARAISLPPDAKGPTQSAWIGHARLAFAQWRLKKNQEADDAFKLALDECFRQVPSEPNGRDGLLDSDRGQLIAYTFAQTPGPDALHAVADRMLNLGSYWGWGNYAMFSQCLAWHADPAVALREWVRDSGHNSREGTMPVLMTGLARTGKLDLVLQFLDAHRQEIIDPIAQACLLAGDTAGAARVYRRAIESVITAQTNDFVDPWGYIRKLAKLDPEEALQIATGIRPRPNPASQRTVPLEQFRQETQLPAIASLQLIAGHLDDALATVSKITDVRRRDSALLQLAATLANPQAPANFEPPF